MSDKPNGRALLHPILLAIQARFLKSRLAQVPAVALSGVLIGKLLAAAEKRGLNWRAVVVANLPTKIEVARRSWGLTSKDEEAVRFSRQHSAEYVTDMADRMKEQVRDVVAEGVEQNTPPPEMARNLLEAFGAMNRDWRRVALTETAVAVSNGYLAQHEEGEWVVGDTAVDCCDWCREHLQGRAFRLLDKAPLGPTEEESQECVWVGKTNVGRSRYPVTAAGEERSFAERWHPCIPAHPHCRCRWRKFNPALESIQPGSNRVVDKFNVWETR
jgi:hypothetical protein